jgi:dihydrofolate reductase
LPKYVLTATLKRADWNNTHVLSDGFLDRVGKLKSEKGADILVYGSASLVHVLMQHGLVNEIRMMVYPVVLGRGKKLFPEQIKASLRLEECAQFDSGVILLRYSVARGTHP